MPIANIKFKTMVSPVTGATQIYTLVNYMTNSVPGSVVDTVAARNLLNERYITDGIDAVCNEVKHIKTSVIDVVQVDNYVPAASPFPIIEILTAVLNIILALKAVFIIGALIALTWAIKEFVINPLLFPKIYYGYDGTGPYTIQEAVTYNAAHNPGKYVSEKSSLVFDTKADKDASDANLPSGWELPSLGGLIDPLIKIAVIIGLVLVTVNVAPPLIGAFARRPQPPSASR